MKIEKYIITEYKNKIETLYKEKENIRRIDVKNIKKEEIEKKIEEEKEKGDVYIEKYEELNKEKRKKINSLIKRGKEINILSKYRYVEYIKQGYIFETEEGERLEIGKDIKQMEEYNGIEIDDIKKRRIILKREDTRIIIQKEFLKERNSIESEKLFEKYRGKGNYIKNKESHEAIWFGEKGYKYGNYKEIEKSEMPKEIKELGEEIAIRMGIKKEYFNSVYINRYENSGMGYHHDNDRIFRRNESWDAGREIIVAVYSEGGESEIRIKKKEEGEKESLKIKIEDNDLYIMGENCQNKFYHKVGKAKGVRYSYTFRHIF